MNGMLAKNRTEPKPCILELDVGWSIESGYGEHFATCVEKLPNQMRRDAGGLIFLTLNGLEISIRL